MTCIAVDPGISGGIAYQHDGQPAQAVAMPPTEGDLVEFLRDITTDATTTVAFAELVGGFVGKVQPASSAFTFGRSFGFTLGVLQTLGVRIELVRPQRWQKALSLVSRPSWKCGSKSDNPWVLKFA